MKLLFLWINCSKNGYIKKRGFNIAGKYIWKYDDKKKLLSFKNKEGYIEQFWNEQNNNIEDLSVIVGANGSGKSTLLSEIMRYSAIVPEKLMGKHESKAADYREEMQKKLIVYEDDTTRDMATRANGKVLFFSLHHKIKEGVFMEDDAFVIEEGSDRQVVCTLDDVNLLGDHNYENILAAIAVSYSMGVPVSYIKEGIKRFKGVEHRIEYVDTVNGVAYYNDSKGTNPDAAIKGIKAMNRPTWLIGGGYDKKSTYDEWIEAFDGKVKELILMGVTAPKIAECAKAHGFDKIKFVDSMEDAVSYIAEKAQDGDAVLLSPACASWGMFPNYEVRGDIFKDCVRKLKEN